jgi:DNA-binding PadR family transcriptional regulator
MEVYRARKTMQNDILSILNESEGLNAKVFSLVRLKLLASLATLGLDGATYRELKAALDINDGVLFANLNVLKDMGCLTSEKITSEGKELELYTITPEGQDEWKRTKAWLCRFLNCGE